ncbi:MAG: quinoprotein dehydrogenase-associated putative ABC transporter substrate-binding protein [Candidatus Competibacterales bacterium]
MKPIALSLVALVWLGGWGGLALADDDGALRICADPNNLPFSHRDLSGFENRIAEILAEDLGEPLEYTWFPQRRGFIRKTLRQPAVEREGYLCELVIGVPTSFELVIATAPYYRSTYALVFKADHSLLQGVETPEDLANLPREKRDQLRIGVFERTPATSWLTRYEMHDQIRARAALHGDPDEFPGLVIQRDLMNDDIDAAIVWGPIAGYFVKRLADRAELALVPMASEPGLRFDFPISMGVRFGQGAWKDQVEGLIEANRAAIDAVLEEYNVPLLPLDEGVQVSHRDDD